MDRWELWKQELIATSKGYNTRDLRCGGWLKRRINHAESSH